MFIRVTHATGGNVLCINSDDIAAFTPTRDGGTTIDYRSSPTTVTVCETFEQLATLLNAQAPESVGTVPTVYNVIVTAALGGGKNYEAGLSHPGIFDANKVMSVRTLAKDTVEFKRGYETAFVYEGKQYYTPEVFDTLMRKIASVMGK